MAPKREIETVLIIEDESDALNFASRVLELEDYHVLQAEDKEKGIRLLRGGRVSLVLLDLRLAGHNDWVMLEQIKRDPELSAIPIIVFTASAEVSQRRKALDMGAADYLVKPLSAAILKKAVARTLRRQKRG